MICTEQLANATIAPQATTGGGQMGDKMSTTTNTVATTTTTTSCDKRPPIATATTTSALATAPTTTSITSSKKASAKIQLRQQKFLAAAARSVTTPPLQELPSQLRLQQKPEGSVQPAAAAVAAQQHQLQALPSRPSAWRTPLVRSLNARVAAAAAAAAASAAATSTSSCENCSLQAKAPAHDQNLETGSSGNARDIANDEELQRESVEMTDERLRPPTLDSGNDTAVAGDSPDTAQSAGAVAASAVAAATLPQRRAMQQQAADCARVVLTATPPPPLPPATMLAIKTSNIGSGSENGGSASGCVAETTRRPPAQNNSDDDGCSATERRRVSISGSDSSESAKAEFTCSASLRGSEAVRISEYQQQHQPEVRRAGEKDDQVRRQANNNSYQFQQQQPPQPPPPQDQQQPFYKVKFNNNIKYNNNYNVNYHYNHNSTYGNYNYSTCFNYNNSDLHQNHHHNHHLHPQTNRTTYQQPIMANYKLHNDCQSSVLTFEQVKRLDFVMDQIVPIHGRGNAPTLYVKPKELIRLVRHKLQKEHSIEIRDVRLNGGLASYVLAPENSHYNDIDLIFGTDLSDKNRFDVIRDVVLECLMEFSPDNQKNNTPGPNQEKDLGKDDDVSNSQNASAPTNFVYSTEAQRRLQSVSGYCLQNRNVTGPNQRTDSTEFETNDKIKETKLEEVDLRDGPVMSRGSNQFNGANEVALGFNAQQEGRDHGKSAQIAASAQFGRNQYYQMPLNSCTASKEAYIHKMVKVNDDDRWSLISLGVQQSEANCMNQQQQQLAVNSNDYTTKSTTGYEKPLFHSQQVNFIPAIQQLPVTKTFAQGCDSINQLKFQQGQHSLANLAQSCGHSAKQQNQVSTAAVQHNCCELNLNQCYSTHQQEHQAPNSIELKFVDRMRRKFEFSVDSFQIILDSLIQFYDYAPQSTITIQRKISFGTNQVPEAATQTRALLDGRKQARCSVEGAFVSKTTNDEDDKSCCPSQQEDSQEDSNRNQGFQSMKEFLNLSKSYQQLNHQRQQDQKRCSRNFFKLPVKSPLDSSVASSSGCSSSSSVVSSSSSSLSSDEDQEDLYCDPDAAPSSSASTSSLLGSTTMSIVSSTSSPCEGVAEYQDQQQLRRNSSPAADDESDNLKTPTLASTAKQFKNLKLLKEEASIKSAIYEGNNCCDMMIGDCRARQPPSTFCCVRNGGKFETVTSCAAISENFYPTVIARSEYGNFKEALYHLERKLIATRSPEEIRGGGLLKYCNLLVKNYKPTNSYQMRTLERYMCSRFFIDFSDLNQQRAKLESYLANHFSDDPIQKSDYLTILHSVVHRSTVCLMGHELKLTTNMIRELAFKLNEQQQLQQLQHMQQLQSHNQHHQHASSVVASHPQQQQSQSQYYANKPIVMQSGAYRVKLVNYTLAKPVRS